jgi:hypothetical protein
MKHGKWYFFGEGEGEVAFECATVVYMPEAFKAESPSVSVWMVPGGGS